MIDLAIIGGTGFDRYSDLREPREVVCETPYGDTSAPLLLGRLQGQAVGFLARHGVRHDLPPHRINYRANLWALREAGAERILAVAAVGGIGREIGPGTIVVPDQIIDYTWGRAHTFHDQPGELVHVDFTIPYCEVLRARVIAAAAAAGIPVVASATYGATQGPRLESAAEIDRLEADGCDIVGMTGMPEAALARELGLSYATCALVVNRAAGRAEGCASGPISMTEMASEIRDGMGTVRALIRALLKQRR